MTVWKWSGESRYPGAFPPVLENFRRAFSPGPTDCPWVSEDVSLISHHRALLRDKSKHIFLDYFYLVLTRFDLIHFHFILSMYFYQHFLLFIGFIYHRLIL